MDHDPFMTEAQLPILQEASRIAFAIQNVARNQRIRIKAWKYAGRTAIIHRAELRPFEARIRYYFDIERKDGKGVMLNVAEHYCSAWASEFEVIN